MGVSFGQIVQQYFGVLGIVFHCFRHGFLGHKKCNEPGCKESYISPGGRRKIIMIARFDLLNFKYCCVLSVARDFSAFFAAFGTRSFKMVVLTSSGKPTLVKSSFL